jgi:hypothetical protein
MRIGIQIKRVLRMDDMKFEERLTEKYDKQAFKKYNSIRRGANIRNMRFDLTFKEYLPFYNKPCFYCGCPGQISLDRLDSSIGYEKNNIVSCCAGCNLMKGSLDPKDFVYQCKKIAEFCVKIPEYHQDKSATFPSKTHIQSKRNTKKRY